MCFKFVRSGFTVTTEGGAVEEKAHRGGDRRDALTPASFPPRALAQGPVLVWSRWSRFPPDGAPSSARPSSSSPAQARASRRRVSGASRAAASGQTHQIPKKSRAGAPSGQRMTIQAEKTMSRRLCMPAKSGARSAAGRGFSKARSRAGAVRSAIVGTAQARHPAAAPVALGYRRDERRALAHQPLALEQQQAQKRLGGAKLGKPRERPAHDFDALVLVGDPVGGVKVRGGVDPDRLAQRTRRGVDAAQGPPAARPQAELLGQLAPGRG